MRTLLLSLLLLCVPVQAANKYIRAGAGGSNNGSSWANAWTSLSSVTWTSGNTYYIAGGAYSGPFTINDNNVVLKKANASDNSGDAGWDSSYASVQAVITSSSASDSHVVWIIGNNVKILGVTRTGYETGHGIKLAYTSTAGAIDKGAVLVRISGTGPYEIAHIEAAGPGFGSSLDGIDGIYHNNAITVAKGLNVHHVWVHDVTRDGMTLVGHIGTSYSDYGYLVQDSKISRTGGCLNVDNHGQGILAGYHTNTSYVKISGNILEDIEGTAMIVFLETADYDHIQIFNNIFRLTDNATYNLLSPGCIVSSDQNGTESVTEFHVWNNTFHGIKDTGANFTLAQCRLLSAGRTNTTFYNNLFENCYFSATHTGWTTQGNNGYYSNTGAGVPSGTTGQVNGGSSSLTDPANGDFTLISGRYAVDAGLDTTSIVTVDIAGNARSLPVDIGAYEFTGGGGTSGGGGATIYAKPAKGRQR